VLFSEPKIPQSDALLPIPTSPNAFQCSSASRKFLNRTADGRIVAHQVVSVLFSEPKIPQFIV